MQYIENFAPSQIHRSAVDISQLHKALKKLTDKD